VFNLADSSIVCGGILAVLLSLRGIGLDGRREVPADGGPAGTSGPSGPSGSSPDRISTDKPGGEG
jgi:signal peptidase II